LDRSFTPQELDQIEAEVQNLVDLKLHMNKIETTEKEAREMGAIGLFGEKYGDKVSVYSLQDEIGKVYSREFCGGPHVTNSSEIGKFKILKQKSVGQGIRRLEFDVE
jgi:alanyl-tRNA synthetase